MKQTQRDDEGGQLPPAQPDSEGGSFGRWLRRHREVRGIDLREIADSSKIGISYLRAFEDDRFDLLPAEIFAKGFLRQYAAYVGLDPEEVVNFYLSARQAELDESDEEPVRRTPTRSPGGRFVLVALALLAALALIFWWITQGRAGAGPEAPDTPPPAAQRPSPPPPATAVPAVTPAAPGETTPTESSVPVEAASTRPADAATAQVAESGAATTPVSDSLTVAIDFAGECWVEAVLDGFQRLAEIKVQGESLLLEADEAIDLKVGNVDVVQIEINGLPYPLERRAGTAVRTVRIDRSTLETLQRQAEGSE